jgi:2-polyprenyl-3-methyl-5-hydroxy-6-metoxy-1,4-benzoquinol methylase
MSYTISTEHPVALESTDYILQTGEQNDTMHGTHYTPALVDAVVTFTSAMNIPEPLSVLDLGCGSGCSVSDYLRKGIDAIGLEGCAFYKKHQINEWKRWPDNLFTADISKSFQIYKDDKPHKFSFATSWDALEHIPPAGLPIVIQNIKQHSNWLLCSINWLEGVYHMANTGGSKPLVWWENLFTAAGFVRRDDLLKAYFPYTSWHRTEGAAWTILWQVKNEQ